VTHEYPPHVFYDSVTRARVNALSHIGFTQRQREFPVTVMVHSGCFRSGSTAPSPKPFAVRTAASSWGVSPTEDSSV
jgi:hypothetical protein